MSAIDFDVMPLQSVCRKPIQYGIVQTGDHVPDGIPCVRVADLDRHNVNAIDVSAMIRTTPEISRVYSRTVLEDGDLLMGLRGEVGLVVRTPPALVGANVTRGIARLSPDLSKVTPDFLGWALRAPQTRVDLLSRVNGSALQEIPIGELRQVEISVPKTETQAAIVKILECWQLAERLLNSRYMSTVKRRTALLQQLLTGKRRFPGFEEPWRTVQIGEFLSESRIAGTDGASAKKLTVKLYGKGVLAKNDRLVGSENTKYYVRRSGQFIYSKLDFLNGAFGIVPTELDGYESTLDLPCFDLLPGIAPMFLLKLLSQEWFYSRFLGQAIGGRKARRVNPEEFLAIPIQVPDELEQGRLVGVFDSIDRELALLCRLQDAYRAQKRGLMQQLLTGKRRVPMPTN